MKKKKILILQIIFLMFLCVDLYAYYYTEQGIQSSLPSSDTSNNNNGNNNIGLSPESQAAIEFAKQKESEIAELGMKLDKLDESAIEIQKEIDKLGEKNPYVDIDKIPPQEAKKYLENLKNQASVDEKLQELKDKLCEYDYNRYEAEKIRNEINGKINEIAEALEPVAKEIQSKEQAGDPVSVTTGRYIYEINDIYINREYKYGKVGKFGKNWISEIDSRIIRCKSNSVTELSDLYKELIEIYKKGIQSITELKEKYKDVEDFNEKELEYCEKYLSNKTIFEIYKEIEEVNSYIDELNKYVRYGIFENQDSYTLSFEYIIYVDESGNPVYCKLENGVYLPTDSNLAKIIKIYGRDEEGNLNSSGNDAGGFIVELPYGKRKYYSKYGQIEKIVYKNGQSRQFEYVDGKLTKIVTESGENLTIKTDFDGKIFSISGPFTGEATYQYKDGLLTNANDFDQIPVSYEYDSQGHLNKIIKADGSSIKIDYEHNAVLGKVVSKVTNEIGEVETFEYDFSDNQNRKTVHTSITGEKEFYYSDEKGNLKKIIDSKGKQTLYEYNDLGVYSSVTENGQKRVYHYDDKLELSKIQFDDGSEYSVQFDERGNLIKEVDRDGNVYEWTYDSNCNQLKSFFNGNQIYECEYNQTSQLSKIKDSRYEIEYQYNQAGSVTQKKTVFDNNTLVEKWTYDSKNRPVRYESTNGEFVIIEYQKNYRKENHNNKMLIETFYNERLWEVKTIVTDLINQNKYTKELIYDNTKKLKKILIDGKVFCSYEYKTGGILKSCTQWSLSGIGYTTEYVYDSKNRIVSEVVYEVDKGGLQIGEKFTLYNRRYEVLNENTKYEKTIVQEFYGNQKNPKEYEYDNRGLLVRVKEQDGYQKNIFYSKAGKVIKTTDSNSVTQFVTYNDDATHSILIQRKNGSQSFQKMNIFGKLDEYTSFGNEKYLYDYDANGNLLKLSFSNGSKRYSYDKKGRITSEKIFDSSEKCIRLSEFVYNDKENSIQTKSNSKIIKNDKYDLLGRLIESTNAFGTQKFEYDCLGNVIKMIQENGIETLYEYNPFGKVSKIIQAGNVQEILYYPTGDVKAKFYNGKKIAEYKYDESFNLVNEENDFRKTEYSYSSNGVISSVNTFDNGVTNFALSQDKNSFSVINSQNQKSLYSLNDNGKIQTIQNAENKITSFQYDLKDRLVQKKWNSGKITNLIYDDFTNSVKTQTKSNNQIQKKTVKYNVLGQVISAKNENTDFSFEYDLSGNLVKFDDKKSQISVFYEYDDFDRLKRKKSDSFEFVYDYDFAGRVTKVSESKSGTWVKIEYDDCSNEIVRKFSNGTQINKFYDSFQKLIGVVSKNSLGQVIKADYISYDQKGRIRARCNEKGNITLYEYDKNSRVISEKKSFSKEIMNHYKNEAVECGLYISVLDDYYGKTELLSNQILNDFSEAMKLSNNFIQVNSTQNCWVQNYEYNSIGSLTSSSNVFGKIIYEYDKLNRLIFKHGSNTTADGIYLFWNDDGQLSKIQGLYNLTIFEYDAENRPSRIYNEDLVSNKTYSSFYTYDAFGRRYSQTDENGNSIIYIYDGSSTQLLIKTPVFQNNLPFISNDFLHANYDENLEYKLVTNAVDDSNNDVKTLGNSKTDSKEYSPIKIQTETRPVAYANINSRTEQLYCLYFDGNYSSEREQEIFLPDYRNSVIANSNLYSDLSIIHDYDCWGNPIVLEKGVNYNDAISILNSNYLFYDLGFRDYSPYFKCFTTEDPLQDGTNWFAFCSTDPVNYKDLYGFAKSDLTMAEQLMFSLFILSYANFNQVNYMQNGIDMGIPMGYDCADVAALITIFAYTKIGKDVSGKKLKEFQKLYENMKEKGSFYYNSALGTVDMLKDITGEEFNLLISGYSESEKFSDSEKRKECQNMLKDPSLIVPGSVILWANSDYMAGNDSSWKGHAAIVIARKFDSEGNVIGVLTLQGHSDGRSTELEFVSFDQNYVVGYGDNIDNYLGMLYGVIEFGSKNSTQGCKK